MYDYWLWMYYYHTPWPNANYTYVEPCEKKKILWDCRKHSRENRVSPSVVVTKQNLVFSAQCYLFLLFLLLPHTSYIDMLWNWNNICMYDLDHHLRLCRTYTHEQHLIRRACFRCTTFYKWIYLQVIKTASAAINETNMLFSVFWCHIIKHAAISFRRINHTFMISIFFFAIHIYSRISCGTGFKHCVYIIYYTMQWLTTCWMS